MERDIQGGKLGRREAQKTYRISANLIYLWLNKYNFLCCLPERSDHHLLILSDLRLHKISP
jgi:hypothetical protein